MIGSKKYKKLKHLELVEKDFMKHFQRLEQFESLIYSKCQEVVQNFCTSVESHVVDFVRETVQNMVPDFANTYLDDVRRSDAIVPHGEVYRHRMKKKQDKKLKQAQQREIIKKNCREKRIAKKPSKSKNLQKEAQQQQHDQKMKKKKITSQQEQQQQQQQQEQQQQQQQQQQEQQQQEQQQQQQEQQSKSKNLQGKAQQQQHDQKMKKKNITSQQQQQQPSNVKRRCETQTTNVFFSPFHEDPFSLDSTSAAAQHNATQSSEDAEKSKGSDIPVITDKARKLHGTRHRQPLTIPDCSVCSKEKGVATPLGKGSCPACWNSLDPRRADPKQSAGAILKVSFLFVFSVTAPHVMMMRFFFLFSFWTDCFISKILLHIREVGRHVRGSRPSGVRFVAACSHSAGGNTVTVCLQH
jgi:Ca-activated chloride channel family protein